MSLQEIWKLVHQDLDNRHQLAEILGNLTVAEKIQSIEQGYLPVRKEAPKGVEGAIDWNLLTNAERELA